MSKTLLDVEAFATLLLAAILQLKNHGNLLKPKTDWFNGWVAP
jgi:hypothetical protein